MRSDSSPVQAPPKTALARSCKPLGFLEELKEEYEESLAENMSNGANTVKEMSNDSKSSGMNSSDKSSVKSYKMIEKP